MKKIFAMLLAALMLLAVVPFAACSGGGNNNPETSDPNKVIKFDSEEFEKALRVVTGLAGDITVGDALGVTELDLTSKKLTNVADLRYFTNLTELKLNSNKIENISALSGLKKLKVLRLSGNKIKDISPLKELTELEELDITGNSIDDYSVLDGLQKLTVLKVGYLEDDELAMICAAHKTLKEFHFSGTFEDISPLFELTNLESVTLEYSYAINKKQLLEFESRFPNCRIIGKNWATEDRPE